MAACFLTYCWNEFFDVVIGQVRARNPMLDFALSASRICRCLSGVGLPCGS
jgi:hypothetical protein